MMAEGYERAMHQVGGFGRYQKRVLSVVGFAEVITGIELLLSIFILAVPDFRCAIPGLSNDSYVVQSPAQQQALNASIPWDEAQGQFSQCYQYDTRDGLHNGEVPSGANWSGTSPGDGGGGHSSVEKCKSWVYSQDTFDTTLASQLNLVCDDHSVITLTNTLTLVGFMVGTTVGGILTDMLGRRPTMLTALTFQIVFGFLTAAAFRVDSVYFLCAVRFLVVGVGISQHSAVFTWQLEMVSPNRRVFACMVFMYGWVAGMVVLVVLAYWLRHWQALTIAGAFTGLPIWILFWLVPESPRWLMSKGHYDKAFDALQRIAKVNGTTLTKETFDHIVKEGGKALNGNSQTKERSARVWDLFVSRTMAVRIIILSINWFVCSAVYYGLTLNIGSIIDGDLYLNFFIFSILELIPYTILTFTLDYFGRKRIYTISILLGGVACLATIGPTLTQTDQQWIKTVLVHIGKLGVTGAFAGIWLYTGELLPTSLRASGLGVCAVSGRVGTIISPLIPDLCNYLMPGRIGKSLPLLVFGTSALVAGILSLWLPETAKRKLPQTVEEARKLNKAKAERKSDLIIPQEEMNLNSTAHKDGTTLPVEWKA